MTLQLSDVGQPSNNLLRMEHGQLAYTSFLLASTAYLVFLPLFFRQNDTGNGLMTSLRRLA